MLYGLGALADQQALAAGQMLPPQQPVPAYGLLDQMYPYAMEYGARPLARAGKDVAVGLAGFGDLANLPVNVGLSAFGKQPFGSPSAQVGQYIDKATGGMTAPRNMGEQVSDVIGSMLLPAPPMAGSAKLVTKAKDAYNNSILMKAPPYKPLSELPGNSYLTNDEYTRLRELNMEPLTRLKVLDEIGVARLKNEKQYKDWEARAYQKLPEFGQDILKTLTYPRRKATTIEHGLYDRSLRDRLKNAPSLDDQTWDNFLQKKEGVPYNFQVPITGDVNEQILNDVQRITKRAKPEDTIELLMDSPGGFAVYGEDIYNLLAKTPAKVKSTIVGKNMSAAQQAEMAARSKEAAYGSEALMHHDFLINGGLSAIPTAEFERLILDHRNKSDIITGLDNILGKGRMADYDLGHDIFINGKVYAGLPLGTRAPIPKELTLDEQEVALAQKYLQNQYPVTKTVRLD